jgi:hypothetical protein
MLFIMLLTLIAVPTFDLASKFDLPRRWVSLFKAVWTTNVKRKNAQATSCNESAADL